MILGPGRDRMLGYLENQMTLHLGLSILFWGLSGLSNHKVGQAQYRSIIKWKCSRFKPKQNREHR